MADRRKIEGGTQSAREKLGTMREDIDRQGKEIDKVEQTLDAMPKTVRAFACVENGFVSYFLICADRTVVTGA